MSKHTFTDGLVNLTTGLGVAGADKAASVSWVRSNLSDELLSTLYAESWMAQRIVNIPAEDALRKRRHWQAEPEQISKIEATEQRLGLWAKLERACKAARLYGGGALLIGTGDDPGEPLDPERIKADGLEYLTFLPRQAFSAGEIDQDVISPLYGEPLYFEAQTNRGPVRIDPTRLVRLQGTATLNPLDTSGAPGWGSSVLGPIKSAIDNGTSTQANIAALVFEASVDVFGIEGLMQNLASNPNFERTLLERMKLMQMGKSTTRAILRDSAEQYDRKQISFGSLPEILKEMLQIVCAASGIPATRLLGQAASGLNSTGDADERVYFDRVESEQANRIGPAMHLLDECIIRSSLGARPEEIHYNWASLRQLSEGDRADIADKLASAAEKASRIGAFTGDELRAGLGNAWIEAGAFPGLEAAMEETNEGGVDLGTDA